MARPKHVDIIDKLIDSFVKRLDIQGFMVTKEVTYLGRFKMAERYGVSARTIQRWIQQEKILYYIVYLGRRRIPATNETMVRQTFLAWHDACIQEKRRQQQSCQDSIREASAVPPDPLA